MNLPLTRIPVLNSGTTDAKRAEILDYFRKTFSIEGQLYDLLACDEAFYVRAEPLRHPLIFYFGHTAAFYVNKLIVAKIITDRVEPHFESLFAIGVDEMSWDDLDSDYDNWPTVAQVRDYRRRVCTLVEDVIATLPLEIPVNWDHPSWILLMGIEHQHIHLETSSVIIRRMPIEKVRALPQWKICPETGPAPQNQLLPVSGARVSLGKGKDHRLYGWDNEYGRHSRAVEDFSASHYLVSNGEFLGFVEAGGYTSPEYWTEEGRNWLAFSNARHPLFWIRDAGGDRLRTLVREIEMPWDWPVDVNYLEAKAFCNWHSQQTGLPIRLPTEEEWFLLHDRHQILDQPDWEQAPGNLNLEHWASSCPVNRFAFGSFYDLIGNVWQWTETPINGFAGFRVHPCYDDFSTPTFDTRHNLIKGGSWISTGNEATRDCRYAFRRHFYQHAGFRYVASDQQPEIPRALYETDQAVAQYCDAHYGPDKFGVPNFPKAMAELCIAALGRRPKHRALDLGCAVGRSAFELARHFESVSAVDFSARFIRIAFELQEKGEIHYQLTEEGELVSYHSKRLDGFGLEGTANRVEFSQGDAHNLKPRLTGYDLILAANLLDRLYQPKQFLATIHQRMNRRGLLVLASPYTWQQEHTQKENWLGGVRRAGEPFTTLDGLLEQLSPHFSLVEEPRDVPFVLRETARKFQHTVAQVTLWEKKTGPAPGSQG